MKIFSKRETLVQNIAFLAIMAGVNIVLLLLANILPYLLILLTLILPFVSLLVTLLCKKRYYPIYIVVTVGLSFLVSFDAITNIFFYILPGLLSGFVFGFCLEKEIPSSYSILYSAFVYVIFSYVTLLICEFIFNEPLEELYFIVLNLDSFAYRGYLIAPFIFAIGIIQSSLSYIIIQKEVKKLGFEEKEVDDSFEVIYLLVFILLTLLSLWIKEEIYMMFMGFAVYEFIHVEKTILKNSKKLFAISTITELIVTIFSFAILYNLLPKPQVLVILLIPIFITGIIGLVNNYFIKRNK